MLQTNFDKVLEFHQIFNHPIRFGAPNVDVPEKYLRVGMIEEEVGEFDDAFKASDLLEMADALGDIVYVCYGAALCFGIDLDTPSYAVDDEFLGQAHSTLNLLLSDFGTSLVMELEKGVDNNDAYDVEVILGTILSSAIGAADVLGIPLDEVISAIHRSNLTKLGADGKPIYFEDGPKKGKVQKGPNYVKPTSDIRMLLGL